MNRGRYLIWLETEIIALVLFWCLFCDSPRIWPESAYAILSSVRACAIAKTAIDAVSITCLAFFFLRRLKLNWKSRQVAFCAIVIGGISYLVQNSFALYSAQLSVLIGSIAFGQFVKWLSLQDLAIRRNISHLAVVLLLICFFSMAAFLDFNSVLVFKYHNALRWSGPWDNPNAFGLLMGAGTAIAVGLGFELWLITKACWNRYSSVWSRSQSCGVVALCLIASVIIGRGLYCSFSRGAWVATFCAAVYLFWSVEQRLDYKSKIASWIVQLKRLFLPISIVVFSILTLCFWNLDYADRSPVTRIISVVNLTDFSWRNRIAAWEGALQIAAEHLWLGAGWSKTENLYQNYYLAPKIYNGQAIEMNDYLIISARLGFPAFIFLSLYLLHKLKKNDRNTRRSFYCAEALASPQLLSISHQLFVIDLSAICCAGAIVLMVGFWFDGGLFKLPTAATFWILLELGSVQAQMNNNERTANK